ncbi:MAG TPA: 2OG-Fe(II) oxygenase family protein [Stellaceae bacterium]|nr:2OG-Fe(II) oxygenase family protein [Stellaceae bacterium]
MDDAKVVDVRGEIKDDPETLYLMDHPDSDEEIPTLDMSPWIAGAPGGRQQVAAQLDEISRTVGFFYLKGHGIPQNVIDRIFAESRRFHSLPEAVKSVIPWFATDTLKSGYQRTEVDRPTANVNIISNAKPNLYAKFSINREGGWGGKPVDPQNPVNVWPENLPGFKEAVLDYHQRVERLARQFLPLWATCLDLPLDYFDKFFKTPHLTLSLLRYPPQKVIGDRQYGIAPHTDNSLMTFLLQADVPGLAVRMPSGHWRIVDIVPGTLLVNTGNLLVHWTNGKYLSTKHRVINTNAVDRYSIPVFFGPSGDALIECLPTCVGRERPAKFKPMTYREMRQWYYGTYD